MKNIHKIKDNIYITSDEEIKVGDYYLDFTSDGIKVNHFKTKDDWVLVGICDSKKIILTTDQDLIKDGVQAIDNDFLQWFVNNPNCEWVEIKKQHQSHLNPKYCNNADYVNCSEQQYEFLKRTLPSCPLRILYKIIIPKEEPKQETMLESLQEYLKNTPKEKVLEDWDEFKHLDDIGVTVNEFLEKSKQETLEQAAHEHYKKGQLGLEKAADTEHAFIKGAKWQQERMYSEEEVLRILEKFNNSKYALKLITIEGWFEQFKKK